LIQQGAYNNTIFHRVIADFMIQGGDPTTANWTGGTVPNIQDEYSDNADNNKHVRGTIAMAKTSDPTTGQVIPNSGSSQFFINVKYNSHLDNIYTVFGDVVEGMEVVDIISEVATDSADRPLEDITLISAQLID
jgi:cyclophilin family peptidyl-prolyl cis-trans isomerase